MALIQANAHAQASVSHVTTASQDSKSMLKQEIEACREQVLGTSGVNIQNPTLEEEAVIKVKDGQVLGLTNEGDPSPAVYTEHCAPDPSMNCSNTSSPQNSPPSLTQVNQYLSGGEDNNAAFEVDNMISEDKSHLMEHSVEDLVHAEILMSLKTGFTAEETELSSAKEERLPELPSHKRQKRKCEDLKSEHPDSFTDSITSLNTKQKTDLEGTGINVEGSNTLLDVQERKRLVMCRALEYVLADLKEMYAASQTLYPFRRVISDRTYTRDIYLSARSHSGNTPNKCGICGKILADHGTLCHHVKSPKTPLLYKCNVCEKVFRHSFSLKFHMKMHKTEDASTARYSNTGRGTLGSESSVEKSIYECEVCGKRLQHGDELQVHLQSHQSRTCRICMKEFSNLSCHMRQHSEDRPNSHNICNKSFGLCGALTSHVRSHLDHKISRVRYKTRKETDKSAKNDQLSSPQCMSVSSNTYQNCFGRFQCLSCPKSFPSRHQLQIHAVYHLEPRFKCLICDIAFYHKYQLQLHQISHTGMPRHVCIRCNQSFLFSFSLRMHMRLHTSIRLLRRMVQPYSSL